MAIQIDISYQAVLLEALNDQLYKVSLELNALKGQPLTNKRKELSRKQRLLEEVRDLVSTSDS